MTEEEKYIRVAQLARQKGDKALETEALKRVQLLRQGQPIQQKQPIEAHGLGVAKEMVKGAISPIASGYAGIVGSVLPGEQGQGAEWQRKTQEYIQGIGGEPTKQTQEEMQTIGSLPVIKQVGELSQWYEQEKVKQPGEEMPNALSSAAYQTLTGSVPTLLGFAVGMKTGKVAKDVGEAGLTKARMAQESIIKNLSNEPEIKVFTDESGSMFTPESIDVVKRIYEKKMAEKPEVTAKVEQMKNEGVSELEIDKYVQSMLETPELLTPRQMEMYNLFGRTGVTPLKADITQSIDDFRAVQDAQKYSGKVADIRAQQETQMLQAAEKAKQMTGGTAIEGRGTGATGAKVFQIMDDVVQQYDDAVNLAYQQARDISPTEKNIKTQGLASVVRQNMWKDKTAGAGGVPGAMRNLLREAGVIDKGFNVKGKIDATQAEKIRQELNAMYKSAPPDGRMIIRDMKDALDNDVMSVTGEDVFKNARDAKIAYHRLIEREKGKRDVTRGSFVEDILYGKVAPEQIPQKLKTASYADKIKFKKFLTEDSGDAGKAAWNDMRAQVIQDAIEYASSGLGKAEGGIQRFQGQKFRNKVYDTISTGDDRQIGLFFNKDERQLIDDIEKVFRARNPQAQVYSGSGPSAFSVEQVLNNMGTTGQVAKGAQKLYGMLLNRAKIKEQASPAKATQKEIMRETRQ